jgi:hypothetical protein
MTSLSKRAGNTSFNSESPSDWANRPWGTLSRDEAVAGYLAVPSFGQSVPRDQLRFCGDTNTITNR